MLLNSTTAPLELIPTIVPSTNLPEFLKETVLPVSNSIFFVTDDSTSTVV